MRNNDYATPNGTCVSDNMHVTGLGHVQDVF